MYIENNTDHWLPGDRLIGECKCNPDKVIKLVYLDGDRFKFSNTKGSDLWSYNPVCGGGFDGSKGYDISEVNIPKEYKLSEYHKWRRVPKGELAISEFKDQHRNGIVYCNDYEIGDKIRIRGFEYEIFEDDYFGIFLRKVEPKEQPRQKKIINDRMRELNKELREVEKKIAEILNIQEVLRD